MKAKDLIQNKDEFIKLLKTKGYDLEPLVLDIEKKYKKLKKIKLDFENSKAEINKISKNISKNIGDKQKLIKKVQSQKENINSLQNKYKAMENELNSILLTIPNIPNNITPIGTDEKDNHIIKEAKIKENKFDVKPHWEILEKYQLADQEFSASLSGSRFVAYKNKGAILIDALKSYMLETHINNGYTYLNLPLIVNANVLQGTGQLPKFKDDLYKVDGQYLIPTAEATLTNYATNKTFKESELPIKLVSYSQCFRKEAGAAGKDTRGIKRLHQFNKVELVHLVKPEDNIKMLNLMLKQAESILKGLKLPYRVSQLCTGELTFSSSITYDLEVWMPGQKSFMEVSSVSTTDDFQAKRMQAKYSTKNGKNYIFTQNGSGLAIDRIFAAILENYQDSKGNVKVPNVLKKYLPFEFEKLN